MLNAIQLILVKVIDKLFLLKKTIVFKSKDKSAKNVLISYVLTPPFYIDFYFKAAHNNRYKTYLMAVYLKRKGYNVYLHDYEDQVGIDYTKSYDIFMGHNYTFSKIAAKLGPNTRKILIGTGSEAHFGNEQQRLRMLDVNKRKGSNLTVFEGNTVPDLSANYNIADIFMMLGNEFVKATYPEAYRHKIRLFNNVTLHPFFKRPPSKRTNSFLFISSVGQVHRGLDLLLDVFAKLDNKLFVLSAFKAEPEFEKLYEKELYQTPNIKPVGFVSLNSKAFYDAVCECDFVILPSCAEGQSSSVINLMAYGLIPVIPENTGIQDIEETGILIRTIDIEGVASAVKEAVEMSDDQFAKKKAKVIEEDELYSKSGFFRAFAAAIEQA